MGNEVIATKENILIWMRERFEVHSWQTIRRWKKRGLPIRYLPNQSPFIIPIEVITWAVKNDDITKENAMELKNLSH